MAERPALFESPVAAQVIIDGRRYLNFGGSSYLGLAANSEVLAAGVSALRDYGAGGPIPWNHRVQTPALRDVEAQGADFFGREAALYMAAGYHFGFASIAALRAQFDVIFFDEWAHHCLREAAAASGRRCHSYRHLDVADLVHSISRNLHPGERPLIVTDGMYSTFGEIAPLDELARAVAPFNGRLLVDESHSYGVLGASGRGAAEHHSLPDSAAIIGGSLGKAFGTSGAIIPATAEEVSTLRSTPVGYGASVGLPAAAAMCAASLSYVRRHPELLRQLRANTVHMKTGLRAMGLAVPNSVAPIAAFVPPTDKSMPILKQELQAKDIFVYHASYIGAGDAGVIRCAIFADHTTEQIDYFLGTLRQLL